MFGHSKETDLKVKNNQTVFYLHKFVYFMKLLLLICWAFHGNEDYDIGKQQDNDN